MAKNKFLWGIPAILLVFAIIVIGCNSGGGGGGGTPTPTGVAKTLVVTGYTGGGTEAAVALINDLEDFDDFDIDNPDPEVFGKKLIAYSEEENAVSGTTITLPLYNWNETKWTGSGSYYIILMDNVGNIYFTAAKISFSGATTTVPFSSFTKLED